ncbi:patatin-like phospholipase family protein [Kitasatospora sp. NBC_01287]|uniref:patatin-like phospholipase family protein n=1 Tax=Kitasatospora sp. NBC_01287 TaxID=2903573 RepID=UPI0022591932|nr:patatin-like phospholipase family protein [Kitasatospora sp. NBC_01287]MCX4744316.1 patatin-like phospholipase family protein [Kitasatospora sp. NBC_01287]
MHTFDRGLVLGPGGLAGTAWTVGLAHGLRRDGVDLGEADLIVGTSAGAIVGALLATGQDLERLAASTRDPAHRPKVDPGRMGEVFAVLGDRGLERGEARRRVGRLALDGADPEAEQALLAGRAALIGAQAWPERRLLITAVDASTGEPVLWDRDSGVPLVSAVAASSAFPGAAPPVAIDGRRYMDGALREGTNADLAAGARTLVVVEPMAHLFPREALDQQLASVGADTVVTLGPDPAAVRAFGTDPGDLAAWGPSFQAGVQQAAEVGAQLRSAWRAAAGAS